VCSRHLSSKVGGASRFETLSHYDQAYKTLAAPPDLRETSTGIHIIHGMNPVQFSVYRSLYQSDQGPNSTQSARIRIVTLFPEPVQQPALTKANVICDPRWVSHPSCGLPLATGKRECCSARSLDPTPGPGSHTLGLEPLKQPERLRRNVTSTCINRSVGAQARTKVSPCMVIPLGFELGRPGKQARTCSGHEESSGSGACDEDLSLSSLVRSLRGSKSRRVLGSATQGLPGSPGNSPS
jgi:hypothetical protein